jgi:glycosyltransferase involved in cell wall biosynthesis
MRRTGGRPTQIGVLGRIEPEKGQMDFVLAARRISERHSHCRFIVAGAPMFSGRAYLDRVMEASRGLPIEFLGWQDNVDALLMSLDMLVVPSTPNESAPRVILEAFSAGVPVVAFPSGGVPEIVKDGQTGFLTEAPAHEALAARIESVLSMRPESLAAVVSNARAAWRDRFTLPAYRERVAEVIAEAAG